MNCSEWKERRLGDLITIKHGYAFKGDVFSDERMGRPIIVNIGNFNYSGGFRFAESRVRECEGDYPKDYVLNPGDILLAMTCQTSGGEILGVPGIVPDDGNIYLHNQRLGKVVIKDSDNIDLGYLYYLCIWDKFRHELFATATGTKILHTAPKRIEEFRCYMPQIEEQKAISNILSSLDEKIELNNQMNKTLEEMAQALFKRWFVDFEFPNEDGEPYKSSGGEMVDSELGMIPKGWVVGKVEEFFDISIGKTPPRKEQHWFSTNSNDVKWVSISDLGNAGTYVLNSSEYLTQEAIEKHNVKVVPENTVLLSFKLTLGRVAITNEPLATNEAIAHFKTPKESLRNYIYIYLKKFNYEKLGNTSSIAKAVNSKIIKAMPVLMPVDGVLVQYNHIISGAFMKIRNNQIETNRLIEIRDTLLPKLMSGELRVIDMQN